MTALVTCAHASKWRLLCFLYNPVILNIIKKSKLRKKELIESISTILEYRSYFKQIIILECLSSAHPSYLTQFKECEIACSVNKLKTKNKGILEFANIANFINKNSFPDDEMIFKLTGRYIIKKSDFINFVSSEKSSFVVHRDSDVWGDKGKGVHTFLFAARAFVIKEFYNWLLDMNRYINFGMNPVEWIFADYLAQSCHTGIYYPYSLNVLARYSPPLKYIDV